MFRYSISLIQISSYLTKNRGAPCGMQRSLNVNIIFGQDKKAFHERTCRTFCRIEYSAYTLRRQPFIIRGFESRLAPCHTVTGGQGLFVKQMLHVHQQLAGNNRKRLCSIKPFRFDSNASAISLGTDIIIIGHKYWLFTKHRRKS